MIINAKVKNRYSYLSLLVLLIAIVPVLAFGNIEKPKDNSVMDSSGVTIQETVKITVAAESANLGELKKRLNELQTLKKSVSIETNAFNIQNIVHNNLLLQSATSITSLERALEDNKAALKTIKDRLNDLTKTRDVDIALQQQTQNQITLSREQATEVKSSGWSESEKAAIAVVLNQLDQILSEKERTLGNILKGEDEVIKAFDEVSVSTSQINEKIIAQINTRKTEELFARKKIFSKLFEKDGLANEFGTLATNILKPFKTDYLREEGSRLRDNLTGSVLGLSLLIVIAIIAGTNLRRFCQDCESTYSSSDNQWRLLAVKLLERSIVYIGILFVLFGYDLIKFSQYRLPFYQPVFNIVLIFLFSRWLLDYLKYRPTDRSYFLSESLKQKLSRITIFMRYFALCYLFFYLALGEDSNILFMARLIIEVYLVISCINFWKAFKEDAFITENNKPNFDATHHRSLMFFTYLVTLGGLAIELAGYPVLALYWLLSWARSAAVIFWAILILKVINEWRADDPAAPDAIDAETIPDSHSLKNVFIALSWLLWFCGFILAIAVAWNTKQNVFAGIYTILNQSFSIGKIGLNSLDILFAVLILFLTMILSRVARYIIRRKLLVKSDMEPGLIVSITTVSIYLMWGLGIILALSVIGVGTTSLAVAFGALGVGLGFGLQTIFNNFISGIILLFERPIQVGDDVEYNGTWATVKKINVRSTIVQTYDNASLIIPNSEFISSVVKNWSFRDKRLRRDIVVGVAYGSDVELVRRTLLEIANQTRKVFKSPKPEVVFENFGDSALIFRLRIWTDIDNMIKVPTEIRFEIDRIFSEQNIVIAFPQMDIHIRSTNGKGDIYLTPELEK